MTAPLTPPDCDLQDFPFMPLHVARLRDSDLAAEASPEACWYAVLLWAASWHQIPAGSLPDNDATLARLIGLGRDVRTFRKHKAQAMHGFVLCDDGRLYHPVVAEQARSAWESKLQQRWRTECARIKKQNQRHDTDLPQPTYEEWLAKAELWVGPAPVPDNVPRDNDQCPSGQRFQETGTGTGKGTGNLDGGGVAREIADDWPQGSASDHAKLIVAEVASPWLDPDKSQGLVTTMGRLAAWKRDGASWRFDVLPVVTGLCANRRSPISTWKFFDDAIGRSIADNRAALAIPEAQRRPTGPPKLTDVIAAEHDEARRLAFQMLDAKNGTKN